MILAAKYARENKVPYLGICLGMQISVIEMSRHVCILPFFFFYLKTIHIDSYFYYYSFLGPGPGRCRQWRVQQGYTKSCCYVHAWGTSFLVSLWKSWLWKVWSNSLTMNCSGFKNTYGKHDEVGLQENILQQTWLSYIKTVWVLFFVGQYHTIFFGTTDLPCLETQSIVIHTDKFLMLLCYLELSLLGSEYIFAYHIPKCGFCLVEIRCESLVFLPSLTFALYKIYCIFSLGLLIETFRYGSPPYVDERHRHRYEVCHQFFLLSTNILLVISFYVHCNHMLETDYLFFFFIYYRSIPLLFPCLKALVFILLVVMKVESGWRY